MATGVGIEGLSLHYMVSFRSKSVEQKAAICPKYVTWGQNCCYTQEMA